MKVSREMLSNSGIKPQEINPLFSKLVIQEAKQLKPVEQKELIDDIQKLVNI